MAADHDILFAVLSFEAGFIDQSQFVEAFLLRTTISHTLADILVNRGWITDVDRQHIAYLVDRRISSGEAPFDSLVSCLPNDLKRALADLNDPQIAEVLTSVPLEEVKDLDETITYDPNRNGRYTLQQLHAEGGIGRVWIAYDAKLDRAIALKELRPDRKASKPTRERFFNEAAITGRLTHPGIVPVYDLANWGTDEEPFYTMPFIEGRTLSEASRLFHQQRKSKTGCFNDFLNLVSAFATVCDTIEYAHSSNVIHRDLKGSNVVLGTFGETIILDWGLSRHIERPSMTDCPANINIENQWENFHWTRDGEIVGTPAFMSPEQADGQLDSIGTHTDIYGLGAILYEILTGHPPFTGKNVREVLDAVCNQMPRAPREYWGAVPANLEQMCLRALSKSPVERYPSAKAFGTEVKGWQESQRVHMEQAWRKSEAFYYALVESLPQGILRKDLEGRFTYANRGACQMFQLDLDQIIGKTDFDLCPPALAKKYRKDDEFVLQARQPLEITEEHKILEGPDRIVQIVKTPVFSEDDTPLGIQAIFWDVTERQKLNEQLEQAKIEISSLRQQLKDVQHKTG